MNAGFGSWAADDADSLARAFAGARVGLGTLAANRQPTQMANAAVAFDALEALQVHTDFAAEVAFDDVFAVLDRVNDLGKLLLGEILGANGGIDVGPLKDDLR